MNHPGKKGQRQPFHATLTVEQNCLSGRMYNWRGVPRGDTQACANPPLIRERAVSALLPLTTIVRADVLMLNPRRDFLRPSP